MAEIYNYKAKQLVNGTNEDDYIVSKGQRVTISGENGNDYIKNDSGVFALIKGGAGDDTIINSGRDSTIIAGKGDDTIQLSGSELIIYESGDGYDIIEGFNASSTLSISGSSYSTQKRGSNIIVTFGKEKITLVDAADLFTVNIVGDETPIETNFWELSGTTAKYGTSNKTLVTVKGVKSTEGLSVSGSVVTVSKSSLGTSKVTISDGYTLKLADDVSESTTKTAWSISGTKTTCKQTTTAGYTLKNNSITYNKKSTETLVTVSGVKSTKGLKLNDKVVTVAKSSLNDKKIAISDGYMLKLADDVPKTATKKAAWSLSGNKATYKSSYKTAGYTLASNKKSISYSKATNAETLVTINGVKSKSGLSVKNNIVSLKKSALNSKVTVSGGYEFDFASDYKNATITGTKNSDTITARGKNISVNGGNGNDVIKIFGTGTVKGGNGADIFYFKSSGANLITDYSEEDKISIASGSANVTISGDDVIFNGKITVEGGADKTVTYIENGVEKTFKNAADDVIYNEKGTAATLTAEYAADSFTPNEYSNFKDILVTIDASAVMNALEITGNKKSNLIIGTDDDDLIDGGTGADKILGNVGNDVIYGGAGEDSLWGGKGSDTLYGGDGSDTFIYKNGDGKDIIADFELIDTIMVVDAKVGGYVAKGKDVTFRVGNEQIVVQNAADKHIELVDERGNILTHYNPR